MLMNYRSPAICLIAALLVATLAADAQDKKPVKSLDDLPRHTYELPGAPSKMLEADQQMMDLANEVRDNVRQTLAEYDIQDATTLKRMYGVLLSVAMLHEDYDAALEYVGKLRKLEEKEAARLMTGQLTEAIIAAQRSTGKTRGAAYRAAVKETLRKRLEQLPWKVVGDEIEARRGSAEIRSKNLLMGMVQSRVDPIVENLEGKVSDDIAQSLVGMYYAMKYTLPLREEMISVYSDMIAQHRVAKADIWEEREVALEPDNCKPVTVAIWDSGLDVDIFKKTNQLFVNENERPDGKDNDGNGFVDDMHGIAFDLDSQRTPHLLHPLDDMNHELEQMTKYIKGFMDLQAAIDSPEASEAKKYIAGLKPEQVKPFVEDLSLFGNYSHGTHVAGIAARGNPCVRILPARLTFDYRMIPKCPTMERALLEAVATRATVEYFKQNDVRVVNMSWGGNREEIENALEANGVGETAEERAEMARKIFKIQRDALYAALKSAPKILFVTSAGNADNDVEFDEMIPSGFDLPNLLVVGAVDQAGDPTDFTSFGRTVEVYANGFEVDSYIPGGQRMKFSGTSMSSPNVANLAAKLLALDPSLTPTQLIKLIKKGADEVGDEKSMLLINPKKTVGLLNKKEVARN